MQKQLTTAFVSVRAYQTWACNLELHSSDYLRVTRAFSEVAIGSGDNLATEFYQALDKRSLAVRLKPHETEVIRLINDARAELKEWENA